MRTKICFVLFIVLFSTSVTAQNGASIYRDEWSQLFFEWNGENVLAVMSSDPEFSLQQWQQWGIVCGKEEGETVPIDVMGVFGPKAIKYQEKGHIFVRVYYATDLVDWFDDACLFLEEGPLVAEGIAHYVFNDNDFDIEHPNRQNSFGYTMNGMLYDVGGFCSDGMVHMNILRKYKYLKNCEEDCEYLQKWRGPALNCAE